MNSDFGGKSQRLQRQGHKAFQVRHRTGSDSVKKARNGGLLPALPSEKAAGLGTCYYTEVVISTYLVQCGIEKNKRGPKAVDSNVLFHEDEDEEKEGVYIKSLNRNSHE